jgi:hypothetical protein
VSVTAGATVAIETELGEGAKFGLIEVTGVSGPRGDTDVAIRPAGSTVTVAAGSGVVTFAGPMFGSPRVGDRLYVNGASNANVATAITGLAGWPATVTVAKTDWTDEAAIADWSIRTIRITLTDPSKGTDTFVTSGLRNVGIGKYVYLVGAEENEAEEAVTGWAWSISRPAGSTTALEFAGNGTTNATARRTWAMSAHANKPPLHMAENGSCVECHTGQGFVVVKAHGETPIFPNDAVNGVAANMFEPGNAQPIGCGACHDPHAFTFPYAGTYGLKSDQLRFEGEVEAPMGFVVEAEKSAVCVKCHANKRDTAYFADYLAGLMSRGAHGNTQADMLEGEGGYEYAGKTYGVALHGSAVTEKCVECHMTTAGSNAACGICANPAEVCKSSKCIADKYGGHTYAMEYNGIEHVEACNASGCHAGLTTFDRVPLGVSGEGWDCDNLTTGIQSEVGNLLDGLRDCLIANAALDDGAGEVITSGINTAGASAQERQAIWNYWYVKNDGSLGVHNATYAAQLLRDSYGDLACAPALTCDRP